MITKLKIFKSHKIHIVFRLNSCSDFSWLSKSPSSSPDGFNFIEEILIAQKIGWREFWTIQICLAYYFSQSEQVILPEESLAEFLRDSPSTEHQVIKCLEKILTVRKVGLVSRDWLQLIDKADFFQVAI